MRESSRTFRSRTIRLSHPRGLSAHRLDPRGTLFVGFGILGLICLVSFFS